jgi:pyruvate dehydrogenase E2 component (dihydrolipoamide acetyltransferase)
MYDFILPDIGEGISEALLIDWSVKAGDRIEEGDEVATISTDKVDVELPSPRSGLIAELCWKPGDTIQVGSVFLRIDTGEGEVAAEQTAAPKEEKEEKRVESRKVESPKSDPTGAIVAAPSTRKRAQELGVDLATIGGSGADGRILLRDVEAAAAPRDQAAPEPSSAAQTRRETLNGVRIAMAEHMAHSVHTLAHSTTNFEVAADGFIRLLDRLAPAAQARGLRLSPAALFAKCAAATLLRHPRLNATIDEDRRELVLHDSVNISIAVASDRGLLVPVVSKVDGLSLFEVVRSLADLAERARDGRLTPADSKGGTFTLSNTGNLERATVTSTRPIINAPQTAILWTSRISDRPRVTDGALTVGPMVQCSLSFDHRFIDGADAIAFVNDFVEMIECPEQALAGT